MAQGLFDQVQNYRGAFLLNFSGPFLSFFGHNSKMPEKIRYAPNGRRRIFTSTEVEIHAPSTAAAVAHGMAVLSVGRCRYPFFQWQYSAEAAVGKKNSRLIPCAMRISTPRKSVIIKSKIVPPPTPHAETIPQPRPHRNAKNQVTTDISPPHKKETPQKSTLAIQWKPGRTAVRPECRRKIHPEDTAAPLPAKVPRAGNI